MYNKKLVASIKSGGKIMREDGETVYLPFGGEYSILLKNLNTVRALVNIEVDGQDVVQGGLIVNSNESIDLERFIVNHNLNEGPRFKFIEKTEQISDHRGDRVEDGIIRITYQFESPFTPFTYTYDYQPWDSGYNPNPKVYGGTTSGSTPRNANNNKRLYSANVNTYFSNTSVGSSVSDGSAMNAAPEQEVQCSADVLGLRSMERNDAGITVHGEKSTQKFRTASIGMLELEKHVICFSLKGFVGEHKVTAPVTVKRKITCPTCGKKNPSFNNCCGKCGTNLTYEY